MSAAEIGRMHVRCRAPRGREDEALAVRARLERTARTHLPGALEPVLTHRDERLFAERVSVLLDFDPSAYDDVTVAALWARRVDTALGRAAAELGRAGGVRRFATDEEFDAAALAEAAATGRLTWVFAELGCGVGTVRVAELLETFACLGYRRAGAIAAALASRPAVARGIFDRLTLAELTAAVAAFERALGGPAFTEETLAARETLTAGESAATAEQPRTDSPATDLGRMPIDRASIAVSFEAWRRAIATLAAAAPRPAQASPSPVREAEGPSFGPPTPATKLGPTELQEGKLRRGKVETARDERVAGEVDAPDGWWTRVAGLAFLYPWLAEYLDETVTDHPPLASRLWALARLADPEDESLVADPLVRLLAGDDLERPSEPARPADPQAFDAPAEGVLASFAAEVPGFAESTPGFVRSQFLARGGLLEPLEEGFCLLLEPAPLDPILDLLPYPVEAFRLPWSPPVTVRRRKRDARA